MKTRYNKYSIYLLIISVVTLILTIFMFSTLYLILDHIEKDVSVIKNTEMIKGSIQRVTKLSMYGDYSSTKIISYNISKLLDNQLSDSTGFIGMGLSKEILNETKTLRTNWKKLNIVLLQYKHDKSKKILKGMMELSERCWSAGDKIIEIYHIENLKLVNKFSILYLLLIINACCIILSIIILIFYIKKNVEYFASHDSVSNIYNRQSYDKIIKHEITRCQKDKLVMSIVLINIDSFNSIKDKNKSGDSAVKIIVDLIKQTLRKGDQVFRFSNLELVIILSETKSNGSAILSDRICKIINEYNLSEKNKAAVCLGTAELSKEDTSDSLYNKAKSSLCNTK